MFKNACGQNVRANLRLDDKFIAVYAGAMGMANDSAICLLKQLETPLDRNCHVVSQPSKTLRGSDAIANRAEFGLRFREHPSWRGLRGK